MQKVKLGICVVYLADKEDEKLLRLHLKQIELNTDLEFTIYAAANRLNEQLKQILTDNNKVVVCDIPTSGLRQANENEYYLKRLTGFALADGCTHILYLHIDSFPIKKSWFWELYPQLTEECPLASALMAENMDNKPHTSFMLFTKEFYETYNPDLIISQTDRNTKEYQSLQKQFPHPPDSGSGIIYILHLNKLNWIKLHRTNHHSDHFNMAGIYGDMVFHLSGAVRKTKIFNQNMNNLYDGKSGYLKKKMVALINSIIPEKVSTKIKDFILSRLIFRKEHELNTGIQQNIKNELYNNFENYLKLLRNG